MALYGTYSSLWRSRHPLISLCMLALAAGTAVKSSLQVCYSAAPSVSVHHTGDISRTEYHWAMAVWLKVVWIAISDFRFCLIISKRIYGSHYDATKIGLLPFRLVYSETLECFILSCNSLLCYIIIVSVVGESKVGEWYHLQERAKRKSSNWIISQNEVCRTDVLL